MRCLQHPSGKRECFLWNNVSIPYGGIYATPMPGLCILTIYCLSGVLSCLVMSPSAESGCLVDACIRVFMREYDGKLKDWKSSCRWFDSTPGHQTNWFIRRVAAGSGVVAFSSKTYLLISIPPAAQYTEHSHEVQECSQLRTISCRTRDQHIKEIHRIRSN